MTVVYRSYPFRSICKIIVLEFKSEIQGVIHDEAGMPFFGIWVLSELRHPYPVIPGIGLKCCMVLCHTRIEQEDKSFGSR